MANYLLYSIVALLVISLFSNYSKGQQQTTTTTTTTTTNTTTKTTSVPNSKISNATTPARPDLFDNKYFSNIIEDTKSKLSPALIQRSNEINATLVNGYTSSYQTVRGFDMIANASIHDLLSAIAYSKDNFILSCIPACGDMKMWRGFTDLTHSNYTAANTKNNEIVQQLGAMKGEQTTVVFYNGYTNELKLVKGTDAVLKEDLANIVIAIQYTKDGIIEDKFP